MAIQTSQHPGMKVGVGTWESSSCRSCMADQTPWSNLAPPGLVQPKVSRGSETEPLGGDLDSEEEMEGREVLLQHRIWETTQGALPQCHYRTQARRLTTIGRHASQKRLLLLTVVVATTRSCIFFSITPVTRDDPRMIIIDMNKCTQLHNTLYLCMAWPITSFPAYGVGDAALTYHCTIKAQPGGGQFVRIPQSPRPMGLE